MSANIVIEYSASVYTPAGWRGVTITALARKITEKTAEVVEVTAIDGEEPIGYASRTGANRQKYNARGVALREVGKKKRLGSCEVIESVEVAA